MPKPNEKLAESLTALRKLQRNGRRIFRSRELTRTHRERLLRNGFLREVVKGWVMSSSPNAEAGDSTPWYASFWDFCESYCNERFADSWHLSPEQSLLLHAENTVIPSQAVVYSTKGTPAQARPWNGTRNKGFLFSSGPALRLGTTRCHRLRAQQSAHCLGEPLGFAAWMRAETATMQPLLDRLRNEVLVRQNKAGSLMRRMRRSLNPAPYPEKPGQIDSGGCRRLWVQSIRDINPRADLPGLRHLAYERQCQGGPSRALRPDHLRDRAEGKPSG